MIGITDYASYIPRYRLSGETLRSVWGSGAKAKRSVANHDEDSITMAVDSGLRCLEGKDPNTIDGLYLASTTLPYIEKGNSTVVANALDMRSDDVIAIDFAGSLGCGVKAIRSALQQIASNEAENVMVIASEERPSSPGTPDEGIVGDASTAYLIGRENVVAEYIGAYSLSRELMDTWRTEDDGTIRSGDQKFITDYGFIKLTGDLISGLLKKYSLGREDIAKIVFYSPNARTNSAIAKRLKLSKESCPDDYIYSNVGNTGTNLPFLLLESALDRSVNNDKIIMISCGGGGDALLFQATDLIEKYPARGKLDESVQNGSELKSYGKYLKFKKMVEQETVSPYTSPVILWRENKAIYRLYGSKCRDCNKIDYPPRRICKWCSSKDRFDDVKLSRKGEVYTFTKDHLPPTPDPPTIMVSADLEGGGRFYGQLTDCDPKNVKIGIKVELCFRKIHEGGHFINYFWKFRPAG